MNPSIGIATAQSADLRETTGYCSHKGRQTIVRPMLGIAKTSGLLGFATKLFNYDAVGRSPVAGWLLLISIVAAVSFFIVHRESWRRIWQRSEDPRSVGLFRILFGILAMCNVNGLWEMFEYLFTDEGLFTTDVAQQIRARQQFAGFGDGIGARETWGFYDFQAFIEWLKGPNYSLLLFDSSPKAFWLHLWAFEASMVMFIIGWQTRWSKWLALFMFHSITVRNNIYWEGTELVYRCFLTYLCLSRCDRAYSVDNWLRCRKLRKQNLLSIPGGPGQGAGLAPCEAYPKGLQAIYRRIPAWPRMLMILQIATIYIETGVVKNGRVWARGDAFYYAYNLDHFYRLPPQKLSAIFGTNLFRINSFVVHYWECFFPLVLLGLVFRWHLKEKIPPLRGASRFISKLSLLVIAISLIALVVYLYPVHYSQPKKGGFTPLQAQQIVGWSAAIGTAVLVGLYKLLRYRPLRFHIKKREFCLDLEWFCDWVLGRRVWVTLGAIFHTHLFILMNIGWFNIGSTVAFLPFFNGEEIAYVLFRLRKVMARIGIVGAKTDRIEPIPTEDPSLPHLHRDGLRLPAAALWLSLIWISAGACIQVITDTDLWESFGRLTSSRAKIKLPETLIEQDPVVFANWFVGSAAVFLLILTIRARAHYRFDFRFAPLMLGLSFVGAWLHHQDWLTMKWSLLVTAIICVIATRKPDTPTEPIPLRDPNSNRVIPPWAYGPVGRVITGFISIYHIFAVAIWLTPDKNSMVTFRNDARRQVENWLRLSQTDQSWHMFAPNPPRSNLHMRVLVTDQKGEVWDLNTDIYACFEEGASDELCEQLYPMPWIWYSRKGKINRRVAGGTEEKNGWWQKWHARYICKQWALEHDGELPAKVDLVKVTYPILTPEKVAKDGPYDPVEQYRKTARHKYVHTTNCLRDPTAQVPNYIRRRHGLSEVDPKTVKMWYKNRCVAWEKRLRAEAEKAGETVAKDDPRFKRCREKPRKSPSN